MIDRRIECRTLGQSCQQCGFFQCQVSGRLAEIEFRRSLEAIYAMPQENLIGIQRENLRLGEVPLDLNRKHRLLHLAMERAVWRKKQVARQLHGQGRCTLHLPPGLNVTVCRTYDAPEVDSRVPVEVFVFNGDQRISQHRSEIVVTNYDPPLQGE